MIITAPSGVIVRSPFTKTDPKIEVKLVDFADAESLKTGAGRKQMCCFPVLALLIKQLRMISSLYRSIDLDIPLKTARFAKEAGCEQFIIVTAVGANPKSSNFLSPF